MRSKLSPVVKPVRESVRVNYDHKSIQIRRGTTAEWDDFGTRCVPLSGEMCAEFHQSSTGQMNGRVSLKVGNGMDPWSALPYLLTDTDHPAFDLTQEDVDNIKDILFSEADKIYTDKVLLRTSLGGHLTQADANAYIDERLNALEDGAGLPDTIDGGLYSRSIL
jgi:hypothetical protein